MSFLRGVALAAMLAAGIPEQVRAQPAAEQPAPGARGYVLTTVARDRIGEVPVRYLGTIKDAAGPGYDVHLVQLEGPFAERVGVAYGMSGSPVYIEGELIGALAMRFGTLPSEPVAGVTPISDMRAVVRDDTRPPPSTPGGAQRIASPVGAAGLAADVREWASPYFEELGFVLVSGGDARMDRGRATELRPGAPVGVELVRGDLALAATGTVTWIEDDLVYAFGHPFLGFGQVEMPMVSAEVVHVLADTAGSFHMTNVGAELGTIFEDRLSGIVGRRGPRARMVPLTLTVRGPGPGEQAFDFELVRDATLTPLLAGLTVSNALLRNVAHDRETTMQLIGRVGLEGLPELPVNMVFAGDGASDPGLTIATGLQQLLGGLLRNSFAEVEVQGMDFEVAVRPELVVYRLEALHYDRGGVRPGESLDVSCVLRRFRGETVTRTLTLEVPRTLPGDTELRLIVGAPDHVDRGLGRPYARRLQTAGDLPSLVRALGESRSSNRLQAVLFRAAPAVVSRGAAYEALPPTAEHLLAAGSLGSLGSRTSFARLASAEVELDGPVAGGLSSRLRLRSGFATPKERSP